MEVWEEVEAEWVNDGGGEMEGTGRRREEVKCGEAGGRPSAAVVEERKRPGEGRGEG